jgi:hypothetical protein
MQIYSQFVSVIKTQGLKLKSLAASFEPLGHHRKYALAEQPHCIP